MIAPADHERDHPWQGPGKRRARACNLAPTVSTPRTRSRETGGSTDDVPARPLGGMSVAGAIDGVPVDFLVDTGAAVSLLAEPLARQLGILDADLEKADPKP